MGKAEADAPGIGPRDYCELKKLNDGHRGAISVIMGPKPVLARTASCGRIAKRETITQETTMGILMRLTTAALLLGLLAGRPAAAGQAMPTMPPAKFEAISIKRFSPNAVAPAQAGLWSIGMLDPSEWRARNQPLVFVVMAAYGLGEYENGLVVGLPQWAAANTDLWDIDARVPPDTKNAQIPLMVRSMLADRFKLEAHWEARPMQAVALTVAPGGPKVGPMMQRDSACENTDRPLDLNLLLPGNPAAIAAARKNPTCGTTTGSVDDGILVTVYHGVTMRQLAHDLSAPSLPVVDGTQLEGAYDITVKTLLTNPAGLTPEDRTQRKMRDLEHAFREELGLNVEYTKPRKLSVPVLVIDRVEKPTAN